MNLPDCYVPAAGATRARALHVVDRDGLQAWRTTQPDTVAAWLDAHAFDASPCRSLVLPGRDGTPAGAVLGVGDMLDPCSYAHAPRALPAGDWAPAGELAADALRALQLGWGLGSYDFNRYRTPRPMAARGSRST